MAGLLGRYRGALLAVAVLLILSPVFGVVLAEKVGYHEPLDVAAEKLGLEEHPIVEWTPFSDYTVPGLPDTIGYIVAGAIGVAVILGIGLVAARLTKQ
ncbi:MAG TPA: cobalamin biosynthesis protein [Pyrodictium sp.]|uniref:Cobalamin biosynthesis protein n=1 Tax=Pyrodictium delaneyi TaxID=1273541 RepID=A0A833EAL5_9CREN|nr:cobalamin biosynthesis protein [Pyrodictium sp.]HIQ23732.1 cobalamin biosynthesis protein [Pyrodictium delaneyi]